MYTYTHTFFFPRSLFVKLLPAHCCPQIFLPAKGYKKIKIVLPRLEVIVKVDGEKEKWVSP